MANFPRSPHASTDIRPCSNAPIFPLVLFSETKIQVAKLAKGQLTIEHHCRSSFLDDIEKQAPLFDVDREVAGCSSRLCCVFAVLLRAESVVVDMCRCTVEVWSVVMYQLLSVLYCSKVLVLSGRK